MSENTQQSELKTLAMHHIWVILIDYCEDWYIFPHTIYAGSVVGVRLNRQEFSSRSNQCKFKTTFNLALQSIQGKFISCSIHKTPRKIVAITTLCNEYELVLILDCVHIKDLC